MSQISSKFAAIEAAATARASVEAAEAAGLPGRLAEAEARQHGAARHARRVVEARQAAGTAALMADLPGGADPVAALLLAAEASGEAQCLRATPEGDLRWVPQAESARPAWARGLGKGRRNASDGPAWDAAIKEAVDQPFRLGIVWDGKEGGVIVDAGPSRGVLPLPIEGPVGMSREHRRAMLDVYAAAWRLTAVCIRRAAKDGEEAKMASAWTVLDQEYGSAEGHWAQWQHAWDVAVTPRSGAEDLDVAIEAAGEAATEALTTITVPAGWPGAVERD